MFDKHFVGLDLTSVENNGLQRPISRVTLLLDDENIITAGDDTGAELSADCPHATQAIADAILAQVNGYQYQMLTASDAALDPAAELGDGVTAGSVYSVLARISEDGSGYASIAAPGEEDLEDEFPTSGPMTRAFNRKIAKTRSQIIKTAEAIIQRIEDKTGALSTEFSVALNGITGTVQGLNETVTLTLDTLNGLTVKDSSGETRIKGSSIDTATLRANSISADKLNLTGSISFTDLTSSAQSTINGAVSTANSAASTASSAYSAASSANRTVQGWCYPGTTYINGGMIMADTVVASKLQGGQVDLLAASGLVAGSFLVERGYFDSNGVVNIKADELTLSTTHQRGSVCLSANGTELLIYPSGTISAYADLLPGKRMQYNLGSSIVAWSDLYVANEPIVTSDRTKKTGISSELTAYGALFDALRPVSYRLINGQSGRTHLGLIAQDVEQALADSGLTDMDFAGFIKSPRKDDDGNVLEGEYDYALRYGEFIAMLIWQTQKLKAEVAKLKGRITA